MGGILCIMTSLLYLRVADLSTTLVIVIGVLDMLISIVEDHDIKLVMLSSHIPLCAHRHAELVSPLVTSFQDPFRSRAQSELIDGC
jgi:hypothetical protein